MNYLMTLTQLMKTSFKRSWQLLIILHTVKANAFRVRVLSLAQYCSHLGLTKKFELLPTEKDYILKILRDINTSKAAGIDRLPGKFLKDGANVLAKPVTDICNLSISLNKFPSAFKLAKVKPIFKKGRKTNVSNY